MPRTGSIAVLLLALCLGLTPRGAGAETGILRVPYDTLRLELGRIVDFETLPRTMSPGVSLEGVQRFRGAAFGERFAGQLSVDTGGFETLTAPPYGPLTLESGPPGRNLAVAYILYLSNQLSGLTAPGHPERAATGEGAISILFAEDQAALGFRVAAEPAPGDAQAVPGRMTVTFFRRDGLALATLEVDLDWGQAGYGFRRAGRVRDIAGVSITNRDPAGIAIDDVIFDAGVVTGALPATAGTMAPG